MSSPGQVLNELTIAQTLGLSALIAGLFYSNFYNDGSSLLNQIQEIKNNVQIEEQKKVETDKVIAEERAINSQIGALSEKFKEVTARFPVNLKSDEIIATINQLAKTTNVRVVTVKKESVETRELYEEVPVSIELTGTFNNLLLMMYNIGTLERVTNLGNFAFETINKDYDGTLKLVTKVIGYKYRKPSEPADSTKTQVSAGGGQ